MAKKRKKTDPLISVLEGALDLGEFISYNRSWDFVRNLEDVKHKIDHSRKYSFIPDFEKIVAGHPPNKPESFKTRALKRWKKQTS
jgi:hypothetical protein